MTTTFVAAYVEHAAGPQLGVVCSRSYRLRSGEPLDGGLSRPASRENRFYTVDGLRRLQQESDVVALVRESTDVLLFGCAYPPSGRSGSVETALQVGEAVAQIRVWGDRTATLCNGEVQALSEPTPFSRIPIHWGRAYGGRDERAELAFDDAIMKRRKIDTSRPVRALERAAEYGVVSYPRNGAGRGYSVAVEGRGNEEVAMPNLEWCARPITAQDMAAQPEAAWGKRPLPACYAPLHPHMYPRSGWLGTWGRHDIEQTSEYEHGYFSAAVLDALEQQQHASRGFFSTAAAGLNQPCLKGGEAVRLQHLHPEMAVVTTHLPTERPRLLIEPPNTRMFELEAKLKTVVVEPELERLTLTWSGSLKVAGVYPESMCEEMRHAALWA